MSVTDTLFSFTDTTNISLEVLGKYVMLVVFFVMTVIEKKVMQNGVLYNADCFDVFPQIADNSVSCILTDLPYGQTQHVWDKELPMDALWRAYKRILKPNGVVILFGQTKFTYKLIASNPAWYKYSLVWDKVLPANFLNANRMPLRTHEDLLVFYKKPPTYNPQKSKGQKNHSRGKAAGSVQQEYTYGAYTIQESTGDMKHPGSILRFSKPHPATAKHPTEKPVALLEFLINSYTNPGDVVLDSCMGSGSTCVAANNTGRKYVGIELTEQYYKVAVERLNTSKNDHVVSGAEAGVIGA